MAFVRTSLVLLSLAAAANTQDLLFSIAADVAATPAAWRKEEVLRFAPGPGTVQFLPREAFNVLFGDRDQNAVLDDAATNIDALHVLGPGGLSQWQFSVGSNTTLASGTVVKDGDIFRFDGLGGVSVDYTEDFLAQATGTSTVDVDAYAQGPAGEIWFSFADDENTTLASLMAQNAGNALLDEQVVFRIDLGQTTAVIHFTQAQVVGFFNQAIGTSATTVVDITGIEVDPAGAAGDLYLTNGSASAALRGRIVSSRGGGTPFSAGGAPFDPAQLGLGSAISLDALALTAEAPHPVLRALPDQGSSAAGGPALIQAEGLTPGDVLQLIVTEPVMPGPYAWQSPTTAGIQVVFPDPFYPMFFDSLAVPAWRLVADAQGRAAYSYDFLGLPAHLAVVQGIVMNSWVLSSPVAVAVLP